MEHRKNTGRLNIRCSAEDELFIKNLCTQKGLTLRDLLINPLISNQEINTQTLNLNLISTLCIEIENNLQTETDKQIFREGMKPIWNQLINS